MESQDRNLLDIFNMGDELAKTQVVDKWGEMKKDTPSTPVIEKEEDDLFGESDETFIPLIDNSQEGDGSSGGGSSDGGDGDDDNNPKDDEEKETSPEEPTRAKSRNQLALECEIIGIFFKNPSRDLAITLRDFGPQLANYTAQSRGIIKAIFILLMESREIDYSTVIDEAKKSNALAQLGGEEGINKLMSQTFTSPEEFAITVQRLKDFHTVRQIRSVLETGLSLVNQGKRDPQQILNMLKMDIERIFEDSALEDPRSVGQVLDDLHHKTLKGTVSGFKSYACGFDALDRTIQGVGQGELILIGGAQGVGKTIMALQMARNLSFTGQLKVLYICFEHGEEYLLKRLIPMESVNPFGLTPFDNGLIERDVIEGIRKASEGKVGFVELLRTSERGKKILERIEKYRDDLILFKGNSFKTTLQAMRRMALNLKHESKKNVAIVVDYLQKVPVYPEPANENEKVTAITEGLKDLALSLEIPVIAIVAADKEGLKANRLRLYHLRGSSAIDYEADIALILNDKSKIISKTNVAYNPSRMAEYNKWVVCTVEKNRTGRKMVDLEFEKHFKFFCFDPRGRVVEEQLIEEKLFKE
jgi:replicative DNA helicase